MYARDPFRAGQTIYDASDSVDGAAVNASVINVRLGYNGGCTESESLMHVLLRHSYMFCCGVHHCACVTGVGGGGAGGGGWI